MMGKHHNPPALFCYSVNLERRIRQDHPLRQVKALIDFSFVRAEVAACYGANGNESVDPELILKMMFLLFYEAIKSERELMRIIPERLDYMWFLGYGLDDTIPDHSVLSKARARWGPGVFEALFVRTIAQCVAAGLVDGSKVHMDGSLIDANASRDSAVKASPELLAALKQAYRAEEAKLDETAQAQAQTPDEPTDAGQGSASGQEESESEPAPGAPAPPGHGAEEPNGRRDERVNRGLMSRSDPDAAAVRKGRGESRFRYKNHRAVDDAHGVITATKTTPGDGKENGEMMHLIHEHERNTGNQVNTVVGDSQYGTVDNFRACQQRGIASHMGDLAATQKGTGRREGIFTESDFVYDAETDTYRCPAGQTLRRRRHKKQRQAYEYAVGAKVCEGCSLREQCTRSCAGRSVKRHVDHDAIEAARAESRSAAARRDRRRRRHLMEGSFADAANNHGFKRSRWRGLVKQQIQDFLIAAVQNVKLVLKAAWKRTGGVLAARLPRELGVCAASLLAFFCSPITPGGLFAGL